MWWKYSSWNVLLHKHCRKSSGSAPESIGNQSDPDHDKCTVQYHLML